MELVPIIYSSLLLVFSLLSFILISSFIYSKVFVVAKSENRVSERAFHNSNRNVIASVKKEDSFLIENNKINRVASNKISEEPIVQKELIEKNKIRVVRKYEILRRESMRSDFVNSVSRYSVVNPFVKEQNSNTDLYAKFSKMSVEYSQTA